jgi:hypothetical protein
VCVGENGMKVRYCRLVLGFVAAALSASCAGCASEQKEPLYSYTWVAAAVPEQLEADTYYRLPFQIRNTGTALWPRNEGIKIGYHLLDATGRKVLIWGHIGVPLPQTARPGETVTAWATVLTPREPGRYKLKFDLYHENNLWFEEAGCRPYVADVEVRP